MTSNMVVKIRVVTKEGCLPCKYVKRVLGELHLEIPEMTIEEVDFGSEEGMELAVQNQILYPPAVFLEGRLLMKGKIRENELKEAVRTRIRTTAR